MMDDYARLTNHEFERLAEPSRQAHRRYQFFENAKGGHMTQECTPWEHQRDAVSHRRLAENALGAIEQIEQQLPAVHAKLAQAYAHLEGYQSDRKAYGDDVVARVTREFESAQAYYAADIARLEAERDTALLHRDQSALAASEAEQATVAARAKAYPGETARLAEAEQALATARAKSARAETEAAEQRTKLATAEQRYGESEAESDWKTVLDEKQNCERVGLIVSRARHVLEQAEAAAAEAREALATTERDHAARVGSERTFRKAIAPCVARAVQLERELARELKKIDAAEAHARSASLAAKVMGAEVHEPYPGTGRQAVRDAMIADRQQRAEVTEPLDLTNWSAGTDAAVARHAAFVQAAGDAE